MGFRFPIPSMICHFVRYWRPLESETQHKRKIPAGLSALPFVMLLRNRKKERRRIHGKKRTGTIRILPDLRVVRTNCSKMIPKYDQTAFFTIRWDNPCPMIFEAQNAQLDEQKMQKMIPKRDHILLSCNRHRRDGRKEECLCRE